MNFGGNARLHYGYGSHIAKQQFKIIRLRKIEFTSRKHRSEVLGRSYFVLRLVRPVLILSFSFPLNTYLSHSSTFILQPLLLFFLFPCSSCSIFNSSGRSSSVRPSSHMFKLRLQTNSSASTCVNVCILSRTIIILLSSNISNSSPATLSCMPSMLWVTTSGLDIQASCSLLVCNTCLCCCVLALLALRRADRNEGYSWIAGKEDKS